MAASLKAGSVKSVKGQKLTITTDNGGVQMDKANVVKIDIIASNGVNDVIDSVIIPNDDSANVGRAKPLGVVPSLI